MEYLRRPTVLAAIAAALLALNLVALAANDAFPGVAIDDPLADGSASPTPGEAADGSEEPGPDDQATVAPTDGATGEAPADDTTADGADDPGASDDPTGNATLTAPTPGTYTYASSGSWSYDDGTPEEHQLPATATAKVSGGGDQWSAQLVAGELYADGFSFTIGADGGLDWDVWALERTINESRNVTTYTCSADTAWYRPGEAGRTLTHVCEAEGSVSTGEVEVVGQEEVTLGDGTVVAADHIVYRTTDSSTSDQFEVVGEGQIDLWLDPGTGLRVRETRSSRTTTTQGAKDYVYTEDVTFLLQSLTPDV